MKIQKGTYPSIPNFYSIGLHQVISKLLRLNPSQRPDCDQILASIQQAKQWMDSTPKMVDDLLETIIFPKSLRGLQQKLPAKNYKTSQHIPHYLLPTEPSQRLDLRATRQRNTSLQQGSQRSLILNTPVNARPPSLRHIIKSPRANNRLQRIGSVRDKDQQPTKVVNVNSIPRPNSQNLKQQQQQIKQVIEDSMLLNQVQQKEKQLIQPTHLHLRKQTSEISPLKQGISEQKIQVLPYLCHYDKENVDSNIMRKVSPFQRPRLVVQCSSPFQLERKKNNRSAVQEGYFFN